MFVFVLIFLILVLIRPQDYPALVDAMPFPILTVALLVGAAFWVFSSRKSFAAPHYLLLVLFLLVAMASKVANGWAGGALVVLTAFAPVLLIFVLLSNAADTRERVEVVMAVLSLCATVLSLHGIEQQATGIGWTGIGLSQATRIQYVGIFNDPNDLGMLFVMCLPMCVHLGNRGGLMGLRRLFWYAAAGILLYGIYLTDSRGTLLALLVIFGIYVWQRFGIVVAGVVGAAALGGMMMLPSRLQELDVSEASAMGRVESWYHGLEMFLGKPLLGVGAGGYEDLYALTAHNSYVLVLAETGIIGFTIWIAFVGYLFRMVLAVLRLQEIAPTDVPPDADDETVLALWQRDRAVAMALLLSLCAFFAAAFFLSRSYVIVLYILAALVVGYYTAMRRRYPELPAFSLVRDAVKWPLWSVAGVLGLYLVVKILLAIA
ncbi:O-antigen ligase family protein [Pseudoxanthomonas beigongshangi]